MKKGRLPLYKNAVPDYTLQSNAGLYFNKFYNFWQEKIWKSKINKEEWIKDFCEKGSVGNEELLTERLQRVQNLLDSCQGEMLFMVNQERFMTGLGGEHPLENGFSWQHVLGVPYLPGSSLKGMVRAWAESWMKEDEATVARIFGWSRKGSENEAGSVGSVIFFDMLPSAPVKIEPDVMTPHYSEYYKNEEFGTNPPADWFSPIPILFLTVTQNQKFFCALAPRCPGKEQHCADLKLAKKWLLDAVDVLGAGAKTAVGYGRFALDKAKQQQADTAAEKIRKEAEFQAVQKAMANMSPIEREMAEDGYLRGLVFDSQVNKWLARMQGAQKEEQVIIAQLLLKWHEENKKQEWENQKKSSQKLKKKKNAIMAVLQEVTQ